MEHLTPCIHVCTLLDMNTTMKFSKWGNGYGFRVTKAVKNAAELKEGKTFKTNVTNSCITISTDATSKKDEITRALDAMKALAFTSDRKYTRDEMNER
jgi:antitoxin component of MazEF toxin-antitoxin module